MLPGALCVPLTTGVLDGQRWHCWFERRVIFFERNKINIGTIILEVMKDKLWTIYGPDLGHLMNNVSQCWSTFQNIDIYSYIVIVTDFYLKRKIIIFIRWPNINTDY